MKLFVGMTTRMRLEEILRWVPVFTAHSIKKILEVVVQLETRIAPQRAIDFRYIKDNKEQFVNIFETCDRLGLVEIIEFKHDYNEQLVIQFYSTLFLEKNDSRHFWWMTEDKEYRAPLSEFVAALGIKMVDPNDTNFFRLDDDDLTKKPSELDGCYYPPNKANCAWEYWTPLVLV
jgi:hypothetical protein